MDSLLASPQKRPLVKRLQARLAASRFLTFSLLLHVVLVVTAGSLVLFRRDIPAPDFPQGDRTTILPADLGEESVEAVTGADPAVHAGATGGLRHRCLPISPPMPPVRRFFPAARGGACRQASDEVGTERVIHDSMAIIGAGHVPSSMRACFGTEARLAMIAKTDGLEGKERKRRVMAALRLVEGASERRRLPGGTV